MMNWRKKSIAMLMLLSLLSVWLGGTALAADLPAEEESWSETLYDDGGFLDAAIAADENAMPEDPEYAKATGILDAFLPEDMDTEELVVEGDGTLDAGTFSSSSSNVKGYVHNSRFANCTIHYGIDVSFYNGTIDWNAVKKAGVEFAIIRAGYRGYGRAGTLVTDSKFKENIAGAQRAGIKIGVYFFTQAITTKEAVAEADYVLELIKGYDVSLPIVFDYEYAGVGDGGRLYGANLSRTSATAICKAFCDEIAANKYQAMVYTYKNMLSTKLYAAQLAESYPIWLAHYTKQTNYSGDYSFWQYTDGGDIDGINHVTDLNFWYEGAADKTYVLPFGDVDTDDWFYDAVRYTYQNNLVNGTSGTRFSPNSALTRGQMATLLYRMAGKPSVSKMDAPFQDLSEDWYQDAVVWAYNEGITSGRSDTRFSPNAYLTRQEMVTFLYNYTTYANKGTAPKASGSLSDFKDKGRVSSWASSAVEWALGEGILSGTSSTTVSPGDTASRAQVVTILHRYLT